MKKKINMLLIIVVILAASFVTLAPVPPPPDPTPTPPPPPPGDCSPGFWKNHVDDWVGYDPTAPYNADMTLLEALQGGKDTRVSRFVVAGWLNETNPTACE